MLINHYNTQTRDIILTSATECFGGISLENISNRNTTSLDSRTYNLDVNLKNRFIESIKKNLELDDSLIAKKESYISSREPIKFSELQIINKSMLPYQYNETKIEEESLIVVVELPIELSLSKNSKWVKISRVISLESFLTAMEVSN